MASGSRSATAGETYSSRYDLVDTIAGQETPRSCATGASRYRQIERNNVRIFSVSRNANAKDPPQPPVRPSRASPPARWGLGRSSKSWDESQHFKFGVRRLVAA